MRTKLAMTAIFLVLCILQIGAAAQSPEGGADGRNPASARAELNSPRREDSLRKFLQNYLRDPQTGEDKTTRVSSAFVDLRGAGVREVIVYVSGREWCGSGGCTTLVLAADSSSYRIVTELTVSRPPIRVLTTKSHGWFDIAVGVQGGGIIDAYEAKLSFDGKTYPKNPTVPPARRLADAVTGKEVISLRDEGVLLYQ